MESAKKFQVQQLSRSGIANRPSWVLRDGRMEPYFATRFAILGTTCPNKKNGKNENSSFTRRSMALKTFLCVATCRVRGLLNVTRTSETYLLNHKPHT